MAGFSINTLSITCIDFHALAISQNIYPANYTIRFSLYFLPGTNFRDFHR